MKNTLTRNIVLPFKSIGSNIIEIIKKLEQIIISVVRKDILKIIH